LVLSLVATIAFHVSQWSRAAPAGPPPGPIEGTVLMKSRLPGVQAFRSSSRTGPDTAALEKLAESAAASGKKLVPIGPGEYAIVPGAPTDEPTSKK
jgi:hypothetical protein